MSIKKVALIIGASRGLGFAITTALLKKDWIVIATGREGRSDTLYQLQSVWQDNLTVYPVNILDAEQLIALKNTLETTTLSNQKLDMVFVCAGISTKNGMTETVGNIETQEFIDIMLTNTLAPMKVLECFVPYVTAGGILGVMSSGQGSLTDNVKGGNDIYRASKAALNMIMKSFALRHLDKSCVLLAPGWVQTDLGGTLAPFTIEDVIDDIINTLIGQQGKSGLHYIDRFGKSLPW